MKNPTIIFLTLLLTALFFTSCGGKNHGKCPAYGELKENNNLTESYSKS